MGASVCPEMRPLGETSPALPAGVGPGAGMTPAMPQEVGAVGESPWAFGAGVGPLAGVGAAAVLG